MMEEGITLPPPQAPPPAPMTTRSTLGLTIAVSFVMSLLVVKLLAINYPAAFASTSEKMKSTYSSSSLGTSAAVVAMAEGEGKARENAMETSTYEYKFPPCAPWIPNQSRVIAMWEGDSFVKTWDEFQAGKNYLGGEAYWSASLDFALKKLGFRVVKRKLDHSLLADIADGKVYKFIRNGLAQENLEAAANSPLFQNANITCRIHWLHWWDRFDPDFQVFPSNPPELGIDPRHILSPNPSTRSANTNHTPLYYFIHSQITLPSVTERGHKKSRTGFLLSKKCNFHFASVAALIDAGFVMHTTCMENDGGPKPMEEALGKSRVSKLVHHQRMLPVEFSQLLREMAFLIGFDDPMLSPSPYEALAAGAAFLHLDCVCQQEPRPCKDRQMHKNLAPLGFPYVYNYKVTCDQNETGRNVVAAAELAYQNPFPMFVPHQHTVSSVVGQVCSNLIEADVVCDCARMQSQGAPLESVRKCREGNLWE